MKITFKPTKDADKNNEIFSDALQVTSKYYFINGAVDIYDKKVIYHNIHIKKSDDKQSIGFGLLKTDSDFISNHKNDWLSLLEELRYKYNQRMQLWEKLLGDTKERPGDFALFYLVIIYEIEEQYYKKLIEFLEQEFKIHFEDYDSNIKKSDNLFLINRGEPWIKIISLGKSNIDLDKIVNFNNNVIDQIKKKYIEFTNKKEVVPKEEKDKKFELHFKKLYPYETSRNDIAYVLMYKDENTEEFPLVGVICSTVGE